MNVEYFKKWSRHLNKDMELKVYGHAGVPALAFPTGCGRFYEFEDNGMVDAIEWFLDQGKIWLVTVDSVDCEAWMAHWMFPGDRGWRHLQYERYVMDELIPFIREYTGFRGRLLTTGCSMGAYHAANFFFKHPDIFGMVIALSGLYSPTHFVGDYMDENVYFNFPLCYLPNLTDPWYLERFRESEIVFCVGQGAWEEESLRDTRRLEEVLHSLGVHAWVDYWGTNVSHDWVWWRKQLPYFLGEIGLP
ncbi:MAG TPA: transposase [Chloroflexi bacterium]|nr:transposase [Chloroflexota bacterium]